MKCTLLMLFVFVGLAFADSGYAQKTMLNLSMENRTVDEVLSEIQKNTGFVFFYNNNVVDTDRKVSVKVKNENVFKVLDQIFQGTSVGYKVSEKNIVLYEKNAPGVAEATQQKKTLKGNVTDASGLEVIGASVQVKGTSTGVVTDFDGNFVLENVPEEAVIVVSYVGYRSQEVSVAGKGFLKIVLKEDTELLDEVVVVGYGIQKKSDITGAVASVKGDVLSKQSVGDVGQALQGRMPGVSITSQSGSPGAAPTIRVRGIGTVNDAEPLYVVDGMPVSSISYLNPNDIASLEVLKDASASAIYGSRGANGVILITTKAGTVGKNDSQFQRLLRCADCYQQPGPDERPRVVRFPAESERDTQQPHRPVESRPQRIDQLD